VPGAGGRARTHVTKKGTIDQENLVDAAMRIGRRVGFERVTMRMVADELGVSPMAAYRHVPSREALINLVTDRLAATVAVPDPSVGTWDERLRQIELDAFAARAAFPGQPDSAELAGGPEHDRLAGGVLDILAEAGLTDEEAAVAFQVIWAYFMGQLRVCEPLLRARADGDEVPETPMAPSLARVMERAPASTPEGFFELGLDIFLDGLRARLATRSGAQEPIPVDHVSGPCTGLDASLDGSGVEAESPTRIPI
jgi:AcrR family transcriptional regulator